jgi:predicted TIM-barrel fold metal-dependent hydrolase
MLVDVHCHIWNRKWLAGDMVKVLQSTLDQLGLKDEEKAYDGSLERLVADMDEAGIDKTIILPLDFEFLYTGGAFSFRDYNNLAGEYLKASPGRIIAFAGVDPRRGAAAKTELKRCVEELGFSGLKLWTVTGFVPDDETYYSLYEEAARLGITVLVHTGVGPGYSYLKTCRPVYIDKIAVDFREINFIMAHLGVPWVDEALAVAAKNPNVYVDISAWQKSYSVFPLGLKQALSMAKLMHGGLHKVLFGTDWPLFTEIYSQKEWVRCIREMDHPPPLQIMGLPELTEEDKEMVLGKNAASVLGL